MHPGATLIMCCFSSLAPLAFYNGWIASDAENKIEELLNEFFKSIRILSFIVSIPLACLYVYGDSFYHLWLPTEDSSKLQMLTVLGTFALPFTLPLESLWNIFTITNKLKYSTLFMLGNNIIVFGIVMFSMLVTDSPDTRLVILACTRSIVGILRGIVFLPLYGAHCLGVNKWVFFNILGKSIVCQALCTGSFFEFLSMNTPPKFFTPGAFAISDDSMIMGRYGSCSRKYCARRSPALLSFTPSRMKLTSLITPSILLPYMEYRFTASS